MGLKPKKDQKTLKYMHNVYSKSLQRLLKQNSHVDLGIERMRLLMSTLGNPQNHFDSVLIAGTNGKGSISAFTSTILKYHNINCGLFTSPHLSCLRERIQINNKLIDEKQFCTLENTVHNACEKMVQKPSFFERIAAMAFLAFKENNVQIAVVEVGLGGRLDATNIVNPLVTCISNIGLDHCHMLGNTLEEIATEKAGIIKTNIPLISGISQPKVQNIIKNITKKHNAPVHFLDEIQINQSNKQILISFDNKQVKLLKQLNLFGNHQVKNAALAFAIISKLNINKDNLKIAKAIENTTWPARYETINQKPLLIIDGAHNPDSIKQLIKTTQIDKRLVSKKLILIIGMSKGHDYQKIINKSLLMPNLQKIILTKSNNERAIAPKDLLRATKNNSDKNIDISIKQNCIDATNHAIAIASTDNSCIIIAGSLHLAGQVRAYFKNTPKDPIFPAY